MSCFLCGCEEGHHLGCMVARTPSLTPDLAARMGLLPALPGTEPIPELGIEAPKEDAAITAREVRTVEQCEVDECEAPKYSDHFRVKYCENHKAPKSRKE